MIKPECGVDFCQICGDCLACYGGDSCIDGGDHMPSERMLEAKEKQNVQQNCE